MKKALILILIFAASACSPIKNDETEIENLASIERSTDGNQGGYGLVGPGPINYGIIEADDEDEYIYDGFIK